MKKYITLFTFFLFFAGSAFATKHVINGQGMSFIPATVNAKVGDTIVFVVGSTHTASRVSQATWNANGTTLLSGGFNYFPGTHEYVLKPSDQGTLYYICIPHVTIGMKGRIIVEGALGIASKANVSDKFKVYPSLVKEGSPISIEFSGARAIKVEVYNLLGKKILESETQNSTLILSATFGRGAYLLRATVSGKSYAKKIIVE